MDKKKILVVEDINSIRIAIMDLLEEDYSVQGASNYDQAVKLLNSEKFDLVITDIKMPGKSGLDLIKYIRENTIDTQYALSTAYNINDFIHFAKEHSVWNIIPKYSSLDLRFIEVMVKKLLYHDIFGVGKYFDNLEIVDSNKDSGFEPFRDNSLFIKTIRSDKERTHLCERIGKFMVEKGAPRGIHQVLEELTSNAMIRAPRDNKGNSKYQYELPSKDIVIALDKIQLDTSDFFEIGYGIYKNTFLVTTRDFFGALRKEEILRRLDRHITVNETSPLPEGVTDSHGRGLFICRELSDHIIFNIKKDVRTEVIALVDTISAKSFKSLSIYEIE
ncbi:MAG: response regulator [Leptospiraceae bacterium]|nr:response regulator [Leptospiraceae bacterium]